MSLNNKRRIFHRGQSAVTRAARLWPERGLPAPGALLAGLGCTATALAAAWPFVRPSDAPARANAGERVVAPAEQLAVIDAATLRVGGQVVRLEGIVAPARGSLCRTTAGTDVDCGAAAANALAALVRGAPLDCDVHSHDTVGRPVAACRSAGVKLGEALVQDGWARAQEDASQNGLRQTEDAARAAGRGIWRTQSAS